MLAPPAREIASASTRADTVGVSSMVWPNGVAVTTIGMALLPPPAVAPSAAPSLAGASAAGASAQAAAGARARTADPSIRMERIEISSINLACTHAGALLAAPPDAGVVFVGLSAGFVPFFRNDTNKVWFKFNCYF